MTMNDNELKQAEQIKDLEGIVDCFTINESALDVYIKIKAYTQKYNKPDPDKELKAKLKRFQEWFKNGKYSHAQEHDMNVAFGKAKFFGILATAEHNKAERVKGAVEFADKCVDFYSVWETSSKDSKIPVIGVANYLSKLKAQYQAEAQ